MSTTFEIQIDGRPLTVEAGQSVLAAARGIGLDIPTLCYLEQCGPLNSCLVCLVKINGKLLPSCGTLVQPGMAIESETEEVHTARRTALELLFSDHIGDCLSPCHRLCPLGLNIPVLLREIEGGRLPEASATLRGTLPLARVLGRLCHHPCEQGCRRGHWDDPASIRNLERFVSDWDTGRAAGESAVAPPQAPVVPGRRPASGKSLVIIGSGPTGLAAAYYLARNGHNVTVTDRHSKPGGSLRSVPEGDLPAAVLDSEIALLAQLGVEFKSGVTLGIDVTVEGLLRGFDAVLLCTGTVKAEGAQTLGVPVAGGFVRSDPNTCRTPVPNVFAAGAATREIRQLVRAMAEGRAAAECVHRSLTAQPVHRPEKPFSSVMGRLNPGELKAFLATSSPAGSVSPCDRCAGLARHEAVSEASRCFHCDCRSSGNCVLQHYAQVYSADANRFRAERKPFEQFVQPGGIIFEPGKCILCGICVKLTEQAREPLGLTFIGRGFDVRIATPFNQSIDDGLRKIGAECVRHCPTGALVFREDVPQANAPASGQPQ